MNRSSEKPQEFSVELANAYAVQAMMSSNAYLSKGERVYFPLEDIGWKKVDLDSKPVSDDQNSYVPKTWIGRLFSNLQFDVWEHQKSTETIIAFKGTDETIDWLMGNLTLGISVPYKSARKQVKYYCEKHPKRQVSLTGHSLGGGLALSVSFWEGLDAIVFNTSPRIFDGRRNMNKPATRKTIFQTNDPLQRVREFYVKFKLKIPASDIIKTSFDYKGENNHRSDLLAEAILGLADSEQLVKMARKLNIKTPDILKNEKL